MYRPEHPRPQWERADWRNLNGPWQFEFDLADSGEERGLSGEDAALAGQIEVPFCPESALSGIGQTDFAAAVWYRRILTLSPDRLGGRVVLHFGAVDYEATLWVNGRRAGTHVGGFVSFAFDITDLVRAGDNVLTLRARDDTRSGRVPSGKQSMTRDSHGCYYTRTTGIWQTVWVEFLPTVHVEYASYRADPLAGTLTVTADLVGEGTLTVSSFFGGRPTGEASVIARGGQVTLTLSLTEKHLWEVGRGGLYDLVLTYGPDTVRSYFGLRSVRLDERRFYLNDKPVFQRLVLDQGFYPEGIYTAPDDSDLLGDIRRAQAVGFNGARLHQKIFEERFLYYADREGYLVWGEYPNWGLDITDPEGVYHMLPEWLEEIRRDGNHPSVVGWCPFNETWDVEGRKQYDPTLSLVYRATKAADPTRPCIDTSGNYHVETDIWDVHDYAQDPAVFASHYENMTREGGFWDKFADRQTYVPGKPVFVSEYGGMTWGTGAGGWGYSASTSAEQFLETFRALADVQLDNPRLMGLCYTQLTDVEQEQNGLYTYDRKPKFDVEALCAVLSRPAAVEED